MPPNILSDANSSQTEKKNYIFKNSNMRTIED